MKNTFVVVIALILAAVIAVPASAEETANPCHQLFELVGFEVIKPVTTPGTIGDSALGFTTLIEMYKNDHPKAVVTSIEEGGMLLLYRVEYHDGIRPDEFYGFIKSDDLCSFTSPHGYLIRPMEAKPKEEKK